MKNAVAFLLEVNYGVCNCTERPFQCENKGFSQLNKEAACLLFPGGTDRSAAFLFAQRADQHQRGHPLHDCSHAPILSAGNV